MKKSMARAIAYVIHDKIGLTYAQCVQGLLTAPAHSGIEAMFRVANRNAEKSGNALWDNAVFHELVAQQVQWAKTLKGI